MRPGTESQHGHAQGVEQVIAGFVVPEGAIAR
jgi:hypothetical protein